MACWRPVPSCIQLTLFLSALWVIITTSPCLQPDKEAHFLCLIKLSNFHFSVGSVSSLYNWIVCCWHGYNLQPSPNFSRIGWHHSNLLSLLCSQPVGQSQQPIESQLLAAPLPQLDRRVGHFLQWQWTCGCLESLPGFFLFIFLVLWSRLYI